MKYNGAALSINGRFDRHNEVVAINLLTQLLEFLGEPITHPYGVARYRSSDLNNRGFYMWGSAVPTGTRTAIAGSLRPPVQLKSVECRNDLDTKLVGVGVPSLAKVSTPRAKRNLKKSWAGWLESRDSADSAV